MKNLRYSILLVITLFGSSLQAKTFAVVIGINEYMYQTSLDGAVNDAKDIYAALKENAVAKQDIHLLTNKQASKAAIKSAWDDIVTRSSSGDTLIVTYAGHGSQVPDIGSEPDEEDGLDEAFLLSAYKEVGAKASEHMIIDDEWYRWFNSVTDRQIVFVADACHSGTMTRSLSAGTLKSRSQKISTTAIAPSEHADIDIKNKHIHPNHVTFFAATPENMDSYERNIKGEARGALSYAFAEAVRGAADNGDKVLRKQELEIYLYNAITQLTQGINVQIPQIIPEGLFAEKPLIQLKRSAKTDNHKAKKSLNVYFSKGQQNTSGSRVQINIDNARYPYLTLYNLAGNGTLQFLWPVNADDSPRIATDRPFILPLSVDTIQGEEQLIAILSKQKQTELHQLLTEKNNAKIDNAFDKRLSTILADQAYDIKRIKHSVKGTAL